MEIYLLHHSETCNVVFLFYVDKHKLQITYKEYMVSFEGYDKQKY